MHQYTSKFKFITVHAPAKLEIVKSYSLYHHQNGFLLLPTPGSDIQSDLGLLVFGYIIVLVFIMVQLGQFHLIKQRALLSMIGLLCIGGGILSSYGLCSALGLMYSAMHSILPFMLLGIGIDDMFVIVQSFDSLEGDEGRSE